MGSSQPLKSPIPIRPGRNSRNSNNNSVYNSIKQAITTGDIENGWGRQLLLDLKKKEQLPKTQTVNPKIVPNTSNNNSDIETDTTLEEKWITPKTTSRSNKRLASSPAASTHNPFANLSDIEMDDKEADTSSSSNIINKRRKKDPPNSAKKNKNNKANSSNQSGNNNIPNFAKSNKGFTATIEIWDTNLKEIVQLLVNKSLTQKDFIIKSKSSNRLIIKPTSAESHEKIKEALAELKNWYTYTPQKTKPKNLLLKRVYGDYNENDVKSFIDNLNLQNV